MDPAIAARIPLVCRTKPPGTPLGTRIADLTALTTQIPGASHHDQVARACGTLNFAALIASDTGLPDLATDLCWRQHAIFAEAEHLEPDIAVMGLMPIVNIARLLIREGDGDAAYDVLQRLYRAAQARGTTSIRGHTVDLAPWTPTTDHHKKICTELWITLLIDGARALTRQGRWTEAAQAMAAHRGIGNRLLDGRQIKIMSLLEKSQTDEAIATIESTIPTEPWESTVAALLLQTIRPEASSSQKAVDRTMQETLTLVKQPDPMTAVFRVRLAQTALDLPSSTGHTMNLRDALFDVAATDAYAARDVLDQPHLRSQMRIWQEEHLAAVVATAFLGVKTLPASHRDTLDASVRTAEHRLRVLFGRKPSRA
ncbi:hypothetical protein LO762_19470 [Actinocorallia sp. API 0066]|uniref:hypothetical protein n=1 Tax=Actinocorallia sp. API 0066 TaxID=2896846 RepID=UPI001E4F2C66|nr:hypothetical protein [Actinocorallia sp. API 0066]MCD0451362.1 hypothetical protein [Actinocorallia sp. API 0066]